MVRQVYVYPPTKTIWLKYFHTNLPTQMRMNAKRSRKIWWEERSPPVGAKTAWSGPPAGWGWADWWFINAINKEGRPITPLQELYGSQLVNRPCVTKQNINFLEDMVKKKGTEYEMAILHQSMMLPQIAAPMFDHVYCLQPSAADNPWLNKLSAMPRGSEEECPHLFINDILVRTRGYGLPNGEWGSVQITMSRKQYCSALIRETHCHSCWAWCTVSLNPINRIKYIAAKEK